jgi:hypothetical protein
VSRCVSSLTQSCTAANPVQEARASADVWPSTCVWGGKHGILDEFRISDQPALLTKGDSQPWCSVLRMDCKLPPLLRAEQRRTVSRQSTHSSRAKSGWATCKAQEAERAEVASGGGARRCSSTPRRVRQVAAAAAAAVVSYGSCHLLCCGLRHHEVAPHVHKVGREAPQGQPRGAPKQDERGADNTCLRHVRSCGDVRTRGRGWGGEARRRVRGNN